LFDKHNIPNGVYKKISEEPFNITTIALFGAAFSDVKEMMEHFADQDHQCQHNYALRGALRMAWKAAELTVDRDIKRSLDSGESVDLESPLGMDESLALDSAYHSRFGWHAPGSWLCNHSLLARFHRGFKRGVHCVYRITQVKTMDNVIKVGQVTRKETFMGKVFTETDVTEEAAAKDITNLFMYFEALKAVLITMVLAGCYKVDVPGAEGLPIGTTWFASLQPAFDHLATLQAFAMTHMGEGIEGYDAYIMGRIVTIDERIRTEWARLLRENEPRGITLTDAMVKSRMMLEAIMVIHPMEENPGSQGAGSSGDAGYYGGNGNQNVKPLRVRKPKALKKAGFAAKVQGARKQDNNGGNKGAGKGNRKGDTKGPRQQRDQREQIATVNELRNGKKICKKWNDNRGCKGQCGFEHVCDVKKDNGQACGLRNHTRLTHQH
jgi:hypothetical protein